VRGGDQRAESLFYEQHSRAVFSYIQERFNLDCEDAEEIANTAICKALMSIDSFDESVGTVESWVATIAANVARDYCRKRAIEIETVSIEDLPENWEEEYEIYAAYPQSPPHPPGWMALTDRERRMLQRHDVEGFSYEQVGVMFGLSKAGAWKACERARTKCRDWVERKELRDKGRRIRREMLKDINERLALKKLLRGAGVA
jgi:DNA-directed RNA polymerase specialized sigma24 family protein